MLTAELSNTVLSLPRQERGKLVEQLLESLDNAFGPGSEDEALKEASPQYHALRSGKPRGLTWEAYKLDEFDDFIPLSEEQIIEEADRRYEELRSGKARGLTLEEHRLATRL